MDFDKAKLEFETLNKIRNEGTVRLYEEWKIAASLSVIKRIVQNYHISPSSDHWSINQIDDGIQVYFSLWAEHQMLFSDVSLDGLLNQFTSFLNGKD